MRLRRRRAAERFVALHPACVAEFSGRALAADGSGGVSSPDEFQPRDVVAWFEERGLRVRVYPCPGHLGYLAIDPLEVVGADR